MRLPWIYAALAVGLWGRATLAADEYWTLSTSDFKTQTVTIKSIDDDAVQVIPNGGGSETAVAPDDFLDLTRPLPSVETHAAFSLHLTTGDAIAGTPVAIQGNDLLWNNPILGEVPVRLKQITAMTRQGVAVPQEPRADDLVTLTNGDSLHGIIANVAAGKVTIQADAGNSDLPMESIREIHFATSPNHGPAGRGFRIRLDDGSSLVGANLKVVAGDLTLMLGKSTQVKVLLAHVATIEQVNGPLSWLSSRPTVENLCIPFLGSPRQNAAHMDRNWTGQDPIQFGSRVFAHGIGVHSYSRLSWALDGAYHKFRTRFAIDSRDPNPKADVTVRILLDGKTAFEQQHVRAGMLSDEITQDLGEAKKLTLEVDYGDNLDTQDRFNWIEPALVRK